MDPEPREPAEPVVTADGEWIDPELLAAGYVPEDPSEPPPVELWGAVGDVLPWGTMVILFSWAAVFLLMSARGAFTTPGAMSDWGASATGMAPREAAWRLLASTFLHAGASHLFFNATSFAIVAPAVERIFTRWRFWIVVAFGGAAASWASLAWRMQHDGASSLSVGGSGVVFALGSALLVAAIRLRRLLAPTRARALAAGLLWLIAPGFAAGWAKPGTDNIAHAAGVAMGALLGATLPVDARLGGHRVGAFTKVVAVLCALALLGSIARGVWGAWTAP